MVLVERRDTHVLLRFCSTDTLSITTIYYIRRDANLLRLALCLAFLAILDYIVVLDCSEIEQRFPLIPLARVLRCLLRIGSML